MEKLSLLTTRGVEHEAGAPLLLVDDLWVDYVPAANQTTRARSSAGDGSSYALQGLSFRVSRGERLAVVGPNGAGKSTLFKVIAGTLQPSRGKVAVSGRGPEEHICIAYVPQRNQIDWSFPVTVKDAVMMGRVGQIGLFRRPGRDDRRIVQASLERVGAAHLAQKQIGELSGGQQQRVFIARALAQEAELLLLDEPFTGLDVPSHEALFTILDDLRAGDVTVLVATHDLNLAAEHFDRVMLLNRTIVALGEPAAVLTPANLLQAYGGHMHVVAGEEGAMLLADTCCEGDEEGRSG